MVLWRAATLFTASAVAGGIGGVSNRSSSSAYVDCSKKTTGSTFNPSEFSAFKLISSRYESHDTRRFYFALETPDAPFSMPTASCVVLKFTDHDGSDVIRPYTPISSSTTTKGHFELIVKKYPKGKMASHLFQMQTGDEILVKGPFVKFAYSANMWKHVGMLAGGSGIAPMYQVIRTILENPKDKTQISLVFANNARKDILLANELTALQKTHTNFNLYLTLLDVPNRWLGGIGYINRAIISSFMPKPGEAKTKILVCGPPPMMAAISGDKVIKPGKAPEQGPIGGLLKEMGYTADQVFKF